RNREISAQGSEGTAGSFQQHIGMGAWDTEGAPRPGLIRGGVPVSSSRKTPEGLRHCNTSSVQSKK
ncbi:hypothetical protein chiPu_0022556, partial [Chiloscyllium punctatum]|nr:hypothetical protein [Chiloscyllium punctatum]